jgi:competence ComEA-like helix-hairpin-helix protein
MPEAPSDFLSPTGTGMPPGESPSGTGVTTRQAEVPTGLAGPTDPTGYPAGPTGFPSIPGSGEGAPSAGQAGAGTDAGVSEPGSEQPFPSLADLLSVDGIGTEEVASIADLVTTTDEKVIVGRVNVNTAPEEVLVAALGLDENVAQEIADWRRNEGPFENIGQLLQLSGMDQETFGRIANSVTVRSYVYSVEAVGLTPGSGVVKILRCTVDTSGRRPNLLAYSEQ